MDIFEVLSFVVENIVGIDYTQYTMCYGYFITGKQSLLLYLIINTNLWSDTKHLFC